MSEREEGMKSELSTMLVLSCWLLLRFWERGERWGMLRDCTMNIFSFDILLFLKLAEVSLSVMNFPSFPFLTALLDLPSCWGFFCL